MVSLGNNNHEPLELVQETRDQTMFLCRSEDELNLDEFETDLDYDENDPSALVIRNLAASLIGEHDCVFFKAPPRFHKRNLKLMVTTEANALTQADDAAEFKAELMVDHSALQTTELDDEVSINCPKSGDFSILTVLSKVV